MEGKSVIFDCHHPKHFLVLKELGNRLIREGARVTWTCRAKDVLPALIQKHFSDVHVLTTAAKGIWNLARELAIYDWKLLRLARRQKPNVMVGNSVSIAHVGLVSGIPSVVLNDDDASANKQYPYLAYPFATEILTPDCLDENHGDKHHTYPSYHELAYLHDDNFQANDDIFGLLSLDKGAPFFVLRFVSMNASHDFHERGMTMAQKLILLESLKPHGRVFVSSEGKIAPEFCAHAMTIAPDRMHDALAFAQLVVGDSQTMAAEAAVLGTPSLRCSSFAGRLAYLEELERRYHLTYGFRPERFDDLMARLREIVAMPNRKDVWRTKRQALMKDKINPTDFFYDRIARYLR